MAINNLQQAPSSSLTNINAPAGNSGLTGGPDPNQAAQLGNIQSAREGAFMQNSGGGGTPDASSGISPASPGRITGGNYPSASPGDTTSPSFPSATPGGPSNPSAGSPTFPGHLANIGDGNATISKPGGSNGSNVPDEQGRAMITSLNPSVGNGGPELRGTITTLPPAGMSRPVRAGSPLNQGGFFGGGGAPKLGGAILSPPEAGSPQRPGGFPNSGSSPKGSPDLKGLLSKLGGSSSLPGSSDFKDILSKLGSSGFLSDPNFIKFLLYIFELFQGSGQEHCHCCLCVASGQQAEGKEVVPQGKLNAPAGGIPGQPNNRTLPGRNSSPQPQLGSPVPARSQPAPVGLQGGPPVPARSQPAPVGLQGGPPAPAEAQPAPVGLQGPSESAGSPVPAGLGSSVPTEASAGMQGPSEPAGAPAPTEAQPAPTGMQGPSEPAEAMMERPM